MAYTPDPETSPAPRSAADPRLSATLAAEYEALHNDLAQARAIASNYQRQLASKSNDYAQLRIILERANDDLEAFKTAIAELRADRHRLANEAQKLYEVESEFRALQEEKQRAPLEQESLRRAIAGALRTAQELEARLAAAPK